MLPFNPTTHVHPWDVLRIDQGIYGPRSLIAFPYQGDTWITDRFAMMRLDEITHAFDDVVTPEGDFIIRGQWMAVTNSLSEEEAAAWYPDPVTVHIKDARTIPGAHLDEVCAAYIHHAATPKGGPLPAADTIVPYVVQILAAQRGWDVQYDPTQACAYAHDTHGRLRIVTSVIRVDGTCADPALPLPRDIQWTPATRAALVRESRHRMWDDHQDMPEAVHATIRDVTRIRPLVEALYQ